MALVLTKNKKLTWTELDSNWNAIETTVNAGGGGGFSNPMTTANDIIIGGTSGTATRLALGTNGNLLGASGSTIGYFTPSTFGLIANASVAYVYVTGMDSTGVTDSTSVITAAMNSLPASGGTLIIPTITSGHFKMNLVVNKSGVTIQGGGLGVQGSGNFIRPYDTTKPAIQIGATAGDTFVKHVTIKDITFDGANSNDYGLKFTGGALHCYGSNIQIWNFKKAGLYFTHTDVKPCEYIRIFGLVVESSYNGANGVVAEDPHVTGGTGWTSAIYIDGFNINVSAGLGVGGVAGGHDVIVDCASISLSNGYVQGQVSGHGLLARKSYTSGTSYNPHISVSNVNIDNAAGPTAVGLTVDTAFDITAPLSAGQISLFDGQSNMTHTSKTFYVAGHTTGSINSGQNTLTVASLTGISQDRQIQVLGAGTGGNYLIANITSISGLVLTLDTTAGTTVSGVDVAYGNITSDMTFQTANGPWLTGRGLWLSFSAKRGIDGDGMRGVMYKTSGIAGVAAPWSVSGEHVFDMGASSVGMHWINDNGAGATISSITQSGTTVTVTTTGSHNAAAGDLVRILGVREPGINGTFPIATYISATQFTYTSTVSQTLAGVTGTPTISSNKQMSVKDGSFQSSSRGYMMRNHLGVMTRVLSHSVTQGQQTLATADGTTGQQLFSSGNTQSASNHSFAFYAGTAGSNSEIAYLNTLGNLYLKSSTSSPTTNASGAFIYPDTNGRWRTHDAAGLNGTLLTSITNRNAQAGNYTLVAADFYVVYTGAGGNTFTLPAATTAGRTYKIKNVGAGSLTVARAGSDTIDGATSLTLLTKESKMLIANGVSDWEVN